MEENYLLRTAAFFIFFGITIVFVYLALMLFLCGNEERLTEGEVYDKNFTAAHSQVLTLPTVHSNGKTTYTTMMPYIRYYPDTYSVSIRAFQDGEWVKETYYVPEEVYKELEIGDMFQYDADRDLEEAPYTQERQDRG